MSFESKPVVIFFSLLPGTERIESIIQAFLKKKSISHVPINLKDNSVSRKPWTRPYGLFEITRIDQSRMYPREREGRKESIVTILHFLLLARHFRPFESIEFSYSLQTSRRIR